MNHRCKCIIISPWTCDTCVCVRVCVWARHRWKKWRTSWWLGQLHVEEAYGGLSTLTFIFMFVLFARVCMKNTSTAWPVLSPVDKRWSSKYTPLSLQPPFLHSLFTCYSDCQGISQLVQLTLTDFLRVVWGSICSPLVSVSVDEQGLVWNTFIACTAVGCLIRSCPSVLTLIRSQNGQLHFISWLCCRFHLLLSTAATYRELFRFPCIVFYHPVFHICIRNEGVVAVETRCLRATLRISLLLRTFFGSLWTAGEVQVYLVIFMSH